MTSIEMSTHLESRPPTPAEQDLVISSSEPLTTDSSLSNPASIDISTQTGALPPTSAEQDFVVSSSELLATDTSLNNPVLLDVSTQMKESFSPSIRYDPVIPSSEPLTTSTSLGKPTLVDASTQMEESFLPLIGYDLIISSSEPLATDTSLSNPASLASSGADDLNADPVIPAPQATPTKSGLHQALWGWLKHTEIRTSPLTLAITLLGLIAAVIYGTSTWMQSSTAADSTAKANRLALFTACVSFPDQPNIVNSDFCKANRDASLDGFAKRNTAAISQPVLWDTDMLTEALQNAQPAWQCKAVCGQERVLHPPDLTLMLSIPISNGEICHLDCLESIQTTTFEKKHGQSMFNAIGVIMLFSSIAPILSKRYPNVYAIATPPILVTSEQSCQTLISSIVCRFVSLDSKQPAWVKIIGLILSVYTVLTVAR
ncbi:hypothetical protein BHYA_0238g00050 [Botrytis hyacinthi]|uniref:Uncharacterized protein n=1 Tax=Botrytis hyacinthi TaxID=278943 RepID=A0A4Z1GDP0_9HELO|nr:hypothetical protein BHYA_0238g00050 [Botrytis hyacinthi]